MVEAALVCEKFSELMGRIGGCFARWEPRSRAGKYVSALMGDLPRKNGWTIAADAGDATPDRMQRLLNHAVWDTFAVMAEVRGFAVGHLDVVAGPGTLRVLALDETGQEKQGTATAGVKRQYMGCAGRVANGINTVHCTYATQVGHALIGARQWIPAEQVADPLCRASMGLPEGLVFKTKPELAIDILADILAEGIAVPWVAGDEVYGSNPSLRSFCETEQIGYVLRVASNFPLTAGDGQATTAGQLLKTRKLGKRNRWWQVRSAGAGSKGERLYKWARIGSDRPRHSLLVRASSVNVLRRGARRSPPWRTALSRSSRLHLPDYAMRPYAVAVTLPYSGGLGSTCWGATGPAVPAGRRKTDLTDGQHDPDR
jgi:SRSO17 transposase